MQDIHSIGGVGTLLGGGGGSGAAGGGDRRLRLTNHHSLSHLGHHPHQALKCPRCDSLNTKFCYYNNYNLSQPRHFCKSCRRYWTRGGVLRNVPVGGGCRKSKRSPKPKPSTTNTASASATISPPPPQPSTQTTSNSHSSSESSSVTATANMNTNTSTAVEAVSGYSSSLNGVVGDSLGPPGLGFDPTGLMDQPGTGGPQRGIFPDMGSGFTSLMSSSANEILAPFGLNSLLNHHHQEHPEQQLWNQEDQTAEVVGMQKGNGDFGLLDWQASGGVGDQGFFDLPMISGVDQGYWSQSQWSSDQDHDHSNLYLP